MASLRIFLQARCKNNVRFTWEMGSHAHVMRIESPYVGEPTGEVHQGQLHKGAAVELVLPSGTKRCYFVVGLYFHEVNNQDPLLLFNNGKDVSEFALSVVMPGFDYRSGGVPRRFYTPWLAGVGTEQLVERKSCQLFPDLTTDFIFPQQQEELAVSNSSSLSGFDMQAATAAASSAGQIFNQHALTGMHVIPEEAVDLNDEGC